MFWFELLMSGFVGATYVPVPFLSPSAVFHQVYPTTLTIDLTPHDPLTFSQVHFWRHGGISKKVDPALGLVMGHEASGTIHSVGPSVTSAKPGDLVSIEPGVPCRYCKPCKSGSYHLCQCMRFAAAPPDSPGTLSKYFRVAEDFVYKVPDGVGLDEAVLAEPLAVAVHAVKLADVRPGEVVAIMGAGTVGLMCASVAWVFGARKVIVSDILEKKLDFAKRFLKEGTEVFQPNDGSTAEEEAERLSGGEDIDAVIEASGAPSAIEMGIHVLRPGGKYVQTGLGKPKIEFPIVTLSEKELLVRGCFRYGSGDFELAAEMLRSGAVKVKSLITGYVDFENATEAWDMTARGESIKTLIRGVQD